MDYRIRDALFDGAITGDYAGHFFWNPEVRPYGGAFGEYKGEIEMEQLDGINVMFCNPNCRDIEKQPYILIVGRDTVENLKREAERWRVSLRRSGEVSEVDRGAAAKSKSLQTIYLVCSGRLLTSGGFHWRYADG